MKKEDSTEYTDECIKYPYKLGLTGEVAQTHDILISSNPKKEPAYNVDVDNVISADVSNLMFGCATNSEGVNLGVLQLFNKRNLTKNDEIDFNNLRHLIGAIIQNTTQVKETMEMVIDMKLLIDKLTQKVDSVDAALFEGDLAK